jgi:hypothetical protein
MEAHFFDPFPAVVRATGARYKLSLTLRPALSQEDRDRSKEINKEWERKEKAEAKKTRKEKQKVAILASYSSAADAMKAGVRCNKVPQRQCPASQSLLSSPLLALSTREAPIQTRCSPCRSQPGVGHASTHPWCRGSPTPAGYTSYRPRGHGP